jgi:hypothetical protein
MYDTYAVVEAARRRMWDELREQEAALQSRADAWSRGRTRSERKEHGIHTLTVEAEPRFSTPALDIFIIRIEYL